MTDQSSPTGKNLPKSPNIDIEQEMKAIAPLKNEPREYRFVAVGDQVVEAILETAKQQLEKAQENFKMAERLADDLKGRIKHIWTVLQDAEKELQDYGGYTIEMSEKLSRRKGNSK
jgi:hypothetical protein